MTAEKENVSRNPGLYRGVSQGVLYWNTVNYFNTSHKLLAEKSRHSHPAPNPGRAAEREAVVGSHLDTLE